MSLSQAIKSTTSSQMKAVHRAGIAGELVLAAAVNIFQVIGGDVSVLACYGKVTTVMAATNTTVQLRITPTGGAAQVISAASANLNGVLANATIMPTGAIGVAPVTEVTYGVSISNVALAMPTNTWVLLPGVVDILIGGATNATGVIDWFMLYVPNQMGAKVVAV
jgi:hypothetical protein